MSRTYSLSEARANLSTIVDEVQVGDPIELTRRGEPIAIVVSLRDYRRLSDERPSCSDLYSRFRERFPLGENGIEDGYFDSLRDRSPGRDVKF